MRQTFENFSGHRKIRLLEKCTFKLQRQETHQEMRYPNVTSLYFATALAFNAADGGFLRKILHGMQRMGKVENGEEILPKVSTS